VKDKRIYSATVYELTFTRFFALLYALCAMRILQRTILIELRQQFSASLFHLASRILAFLVIKANQVQNPMNEKTRNGAVE
jgi:hypothetical protein